MSRPKREKSPLYFKIGAAEFYPLGFMDAMDVFRTTQLGRTRNELRLDSFSITHSPGASQSSLFVPKLAHRSENPREVRLG